MECEVKYDEEIYERVMDSFDALPLACIINEKFVAVHGGISPDVESVNLIYNSLFNSLQKLISFRDL
jgi:diadenosine tetraphosphatase ApaH/serine/threonine PP2A family protein phosphatase